MKAEIKVCVGNLDLTSIKAIGIKKVSVSEWKGQKYLWLDGTRAESKLNHKEEKIEIYSGERYIYIFYTTGSWKNRYEEFHGIYDMKKQKWLMKIGKTDEVNREEFDELKSEMLDEGYAISRSKGAHNVLAYYFMKYFQNDEKTLEEKIKEEIEKIERKYGVKIEWRVRE